MRALDHAVEGRVVREFGRVGLLTAARDDHTLRGFAFAGAATEGGGGGGGRGCDDPGWVAWQRAEVAAVRAEAAAAAASGVGSAMPATPEARRAAGEGGDTDGGGCPVGCTVASWP